MPSTLGIVSSHYVELPPPTFTGQTVLRLEGEGTNGSNNNLPITDVANSFTVPTPLTSSANTSLLLNAPLPSIFDSSPKQQLISTVGNAQISTAQKKNGNSSIYFDGTGDFLKIPHSNDFVFGSKNFMISTWVYPLNLTGYRALFSKRPTTTGSGGGYAGVIFRTNGSNLEAYLTFTGNSWTSIISSRPLTLTSWQHIALYRLNSTFTLYLNGKPVATATDNRAIVDSTTASVTIGADSDTATTSYSNVYIDDFVIMTNP